MEPLVLELEDSRVRYHHHERNLGRVQAVANGLHATKGEYLTEIDDDDEWEPEFLSVLATALDEHPSAGLAFCDTWSIDEAGTIDEVASDATAAIWGRAGLRAGLHEPAAQLACDGVIATSSAAIFRRSAVDLDDFPDGLVHAQDLWIAYLATRDHRGIVYEPRRLAVTAPRQPVRRARADKQPA